MRRSYRTIKGNGLWVDIARDSKARTFSFVVRYSEPREGRSATLSLPMTAIRRWRDAEDYAQQIANLAA